MRKFAIVSFAAVLLGSSAALAQPYGYQPGYVAPGNQCPLPAANYIVDPATGQPIPQAAYQARYPATNPATWSFSCNTGLWTDPAAGSYAPQAQYYGGDQGRGREEGRDRDNRDHDNGDRDNRDRGDDR